MRAYLKQTEPLIATEPSKDAAAWKSLRAEFDARKEFSSTGDRRPWIQTAGEVLLDEALSKREREILNLLAKRLSNKEIGDELVLSVRTVQGHLRSIFSKLNVGSRTEAVFQALKEGWVSLDDVS